MRTAGNTGISPKTDFDIIRQGVQGVFVTFLILALLGACASMPRDPSYDGGLGGGGGGEVPMPRCTDICWLMSVRNDNYSEAHVYVGGHRVARLPGMMAKDVRVPIRQTMLDGAGCMVVHVKLYPEMRTASSSKECPVPGSRLELAVAASNGGHPVQLWLQDWRTR